jgi:hypothetical protein
MDFPMNEALLEETTRLKEERRVVRERLEKVEASKADVSPAVYERVRGDYLKKLESADQALIAKKSEVDKELATLYAARTKVGENVQQTKEALEELKFRQSLGEFAAGEFEQQSGDASEKVAKFDAVLSAIMGNIGRYETLFAEEVGLLPDGPAPAPPPAPMPQTRAFSPEDLSEKTPALGANGYQLSGEEGNYFKPQQMSETSIFNPDDLEADTEIGPEPTPPPGPTLTILRGTGEGNIFALHKETTIGRGKDNTVVLREAKVSRRHALLTTDGTQWNIVDMQSSNGVLVNGSKVTESAVADGDQIQIGDFLLEFRE